MERNLSAPERGCSAGPVRGPAPAGTAPLLRGGSGRPGAPARWVRGNPTAFPLPFPQGSRSGNTDGKTAVTTLRATVDDRGRILIPQELRQATGLTSGAPVVIEGTEDGVRLRRARPVDEALGRLEGAIHEGNRQAEAEDLEPEDVKDQWEPEP